MKTKFVTTALILTSSLIAGASFAADGAAKTREQVRADYVQARAEGSLPPVFQDGDRSIKTGTTTLTREAVKADYLAAKNAGTLPPTVEGQDYKLQVGNSTLTREAVRAEYQAAKKAGTLIERTEAS